MPTQRALISREFHSKFIDLLPYIMMQKEIIGVQTGSFPYFDKEWNLKHKRSRLFRNYIKIVVNQRTNSAIYVLLRRNGVKSFLSSQGVSIFPGIKI